MNNTNKLIPELRFPEFVNNETWAERKLSDVLFEHKEKSSGKEEVYSVSVHKGVVNQIEHLGRVFASNNTEFSQQCGQVYQRWKKYRERKIGFRNR